MTNSTIPFPKYENGNLYRKIEQKLEFIDEYVVFSKGKTRGFSTSLTKIQLYNLLYELVDKRDKSEEQTAIKQLLNMIRLYMSKEEKEQLNKKWIRC